MYLINGLGICARMTVGLSLILRLAVLSAGNSLYQNRSVKYESGEVASSWIPAIENPGHMKGFVAEHDLMVSDRLAGRERSDPGGFARKLQDNGSALAKATEVYAATLLTYNAGHHFGGPGLDLGDSAQRDWVSANCSEPGAKHCRRGFDACGRHQGA
jgi:methyl-accepting chemotaxis protein-1 (serine sensor receptor)